MGSFLWQFGQEMWNLLMMMSPYLLFGFLMAGFLHVFLSRDKIAHHLAGNNFTSVFKASLFGVPLPVCSCGIIPVAAHFKKQGASRGATVSFLTSTPTTGVDSILATYALMGGLFAVFRPIVAFLSGLISGVLVNKTSFPEEKIFENSEFEKTSIVSQASKWTQIKEAFRYAFVDILADIGKWIILGIILGALINVLLPVSFVEKYLSSSLSAYFLMFLLGLPLYVCSTGSIPIATALLSKGIAPGAALVFLIVGPATNSATLAYVAGDFGKRVLALYLGVLVLVSLFFGILLDFLWPYFYSNINFMESHSEMFPAGLETFCGIIFLVLLLRLYIRLPVNKGQKSQIYHIPKMSCQNCIRKLEAIILKIEGIKAIDFTLAEKSARVFGNFEEEKIRQVIINAGYPGTEIQK